MVKKLVDDIKESVDLFSKWDVYKKVWFCVEFLMLTTLCYGSVSGVFYFILVIFLRRKDKDCYTYIVMMSLSLMVMAAGLGVYRLCT